MKGFLSRLGVGAADVRIVPSTERVTPGETIEIDVEIEGGEATQNADKFFTKVSSTMSIQSSLDHANYPIYPEKSAWKLGAKAAGIEDANDPLLENTIDVDVVAEELTIEPDELWRETTTFTIPHMTPVTMSDISVYLAGKLDVFASRNPNSERHYISVEPDERYEELFAAMEAMGFELLGSGMVDPSGGAEFRPATEPNVYLDETPTNQFFRYLPREKPYSEQFDVFDLGVLAIEDGLKVNVDPGNIPDGDPNATFEDPEADGVRARLEQLIEEYY